MKTFASDNYSGIHPDILNAINKANKGHEISYGDDTFTTEAQQAFEREFGEVMVLYAFNGTGANVVALKTCLLPFQSILCAETAHIYVDECGAPVQGSGSMIIPYKTKDGKLKPEMLEKEISQLGNVHHVQPKVISISQSTELGTVYTLNELKALTDFAHRNDMYVHLDGARISNAVASLGISLREATVDCGIDIMSFGGTKNGLMIGEAILIFNEKLKKNAAFLHKQSAQLFSKNRFIAAQFSALLNDECWRKMALHSNNMAQRIASQLSKIKEVSIIQPVQANALFVIIPQHAVEPLREAYRFYDWDTETGALRWMCSFDTTEEDVDNFINKLKGLL
ncbi:MAG: low specificity L-threonine aldolase [Paludibacteraceae bacterium]